MYRNKKAIIAKRFQQGFLLPLALFIIVVMGALALTISRTSTQTQSSSVQELANIQAFYAAESGAQRGMNALFFNNVTRQTTDAACASMAINRNYAGVNGLQQCTAQVVCACRYRDNSVCNANTAANYQNNAPIGVSQSFYTVTSEGGCGQQHFRSVRTIQVSAFLIQE
ncbi:MAG TPA: MSHA biogenesis protein MshP [Cellvibrio sp.]|nr:MSHA biogenesis protein MshP [Cellvibrio sp.]